MSSSSEEDPEELERLKQMQEAASEHLYTALKKEHFPAEKKCLPKDLPSRNKGRTRQDEHIELNTTPEFRAHVAKKLSDYLDKLIDTVDCGGAVTQQDVEGGIKLLSSSKTYVAEASAEILPTKRKLKTAPNIESSSSSDEDHEELAAICVSGEAILNGGEGIFKRTANKISGENHLMDASKPSAEGKKIRKKLKNT